MSSDKGHFVYEELIVFINYDICTLQALQYSSIISRKLGCDQEQELLMCLQSQSLNDIVKTAGLIGEQGALIWLAVPDGEFTSDPYLPGT